MRFLVLIFGCQGFAAYASSRDIKEEHVVTAQIRHLTHSSCRRFSYWKINDTQNDVVLILDKSTLKWAEHSTSSV